MALRLIVAVAVLGVGVIRAFENTEAGLAYLMISILLWVWTINADEISFLQRRIEALKWEIFKFHAPKDR